MTNNSKLKTQNSKVKNNKASIASNAHAKSMAELMARFSSHITPLKKGDIVQGIVKKLTPSEITLDIGAKSDALVLEFDKKNIDNLLKYLKVGDSVKASVLSPESEDGFPVVSLRRTLDDLIFLKLEDITNKQETITIHVSEGTRGGFFAETEEGVHGFLPNSQVLSDHNLIGKDTQVKIIEFERSKKRVIFSEKATVYLTNPAQMQQYIQKGEVVEATIQYVSNHGLYTSFPIKTVGVVEGFIHISEISYQRVEDMYKLFQKGGKVKAQVIDIDQEARRVNLSIKRLEKDTFEDVQAHYKKEQLVKGVVKSTKGKGVTLELAPHVVGFIPESKVSSQTPYSEGEEVEAVVEDFDQRRRLVILTPVLKTKPIGYR